MSSPTRYMYPINNRDKYKAYILFTPIEKRGPTYEQKEVIRGPSSARSSDMSFPNTPPPGTRRIVTVGGAVDEVIDATKKTANSVGRFFENSKLTAGTERYLNESVALYMPTPVTIADGVSINNADLGILGASTATAIEQGSGVVSAIGDAVGTAGKSLIEGLKGNLSGDAASLLASRVAAGLPGQTDAVRGALRVTPNPNTRMIFRSVNIREFSFDFKMVPTSVEEQNHIRNIVSFFRRNLYPETIPLEGLDTSVSAGYKFPNIFQVNLIYDGRDLGEKNPNLSFKHMYLKSFSASYNNTGGFYKDGEFNEVSIQVAFAEEFTLDKKDAMTNQSPKSLIAKNQADTRTRSALNDRARGINRGF